MVCPHLHIKMHKQSMKITAYGFTGNFILILKTSAIKGLNYCFSK